MKKFLILLLALTLVCSGLAIVPAGATEEKVALSFLDISPRADRSNYYQEVFKRYTEEVNPNVTIAYDEVPWADSYSKVMVLGSSNDLPDLLNVYSAWIPDLRTAGWIIPLDEYIEKSGIKDEFTSATMITLQDEIDAYGAIYYLPDGISTNGIYVRKDWIQEMLGIDYMDLMEDWTWERYFQLCHELTDPEKNRYGISFRGGMNGVDRVTEFLVSAHDPIGEMWANTDDLDNLDYLLDTPQDAELLKEFVGLYWDKCSPEDSINWGFVEMVDAFAGGLTGTLRNDMEVVATLLASDLTTDQWGVLPTPFAADGVSYTYLGAIYQYGISGQTEYPDQTWDVIMWLLDGSNNAEYCKIMTEFPVVKSASDDPFFSEDGPMAGFYYIMNEAKLGFAQSTYGPGDTTQVRSVDGTAMLQKVLAKEMTVEEWLTWFDDSITEITKAYLEDYPDMAHFGEVKIFE